MKSNEESSRPHRDATLPMVMQSILICTLFLILLLGSLKALPEIVTANTTVNGRELPIYCVDTQEKKIALSFDAAWADTIYGL